MFYTYRQQQNAQQYNPYGNYYQGYQYPYQQNYWQGYNQNYYNQYYQNYPQDNSQTQVYIYNQCFNQKNKRAGQFCEFKGTKCDGALRRSRGNKKLFENKAWNGCFRGDFHWYILENLGLQ